MSKDWIRKSSGSVLRLNRYLNLCSPLFRNYFALSRLAAKTPDVNWTKKKDINEAFGYYDGKQFKFLNPCNIDYAKYGKDRPKYDE